MRVLVLGGTEFISLHIVRALRREGHQVAVLNRGRHLERLPDGDEVAVLNRGRRRVRLPDGVTTLVGDRKDHAALRHVLAGVTVGGVIDVTYAPTTGEDVEAVLDGLGERAGHVVFVSTGRVYDHARPIPFDEETPRSLYWGEYAKNKIAAEDVLLRRHRERGLPVTIVRPTHVYGPLNTRDNETFFFDRLVRGRPVLVPGSGGWLRQFGHVQDLAAAIVRILGVPAAFGQAYNVSGEECTTQVGFVELIADVIRRPLTLVRCPVLPPGVKSAPFGQNLVYDCHAIYTTTKLRAELDITPRYTLASGLAQTFDWYLSEGLDRRPVDFSSEDAILRRQGGPCR